MLLQKLGMGLLGLFLAGQVCAQVSRFNLAEKQWLDDHQNLKVGVVQMTAPVLYFEGGQAMGLAADYLRALSSKTGLNLDIVKYNNSERLEQGLREGEIDLIGAMVHSASSSTDLHFSRPYLNLPAALYGKGKITAQGLADIAGGEIAVLAGSIWEEVLPHYLPGLRAKSFPTLDAALQSVLDGRIQVYLGDAASVDHLLKVGQFNGLTASQRLDLTLDIALVTHASTPVLHSLLQKAMDRLSEEEIHEIWNNWPGIERPLPYQSGFLVYLLWGVLLIAWSLLLMWIVKKRSKQGLEHHRSKTRRSIKRLRRREELLKQKLMQIKHKTKRYRNRSKKLQHQITFMEEILPSASWSWDPANGDCFWEDDMFTLTGLEKDEFKPTLESFLALVHEQDRVLLEPLLQKETTGSSKISYRIVLPDGTEIQLLQYSHFEGAAEESDPKWVCICWRIDNYSSAQNQRHLSVVPAATSIKDEKAGD
ncbi:MAG: transporter substrate-binding domain-containing protein [Candidatus Thiodiazotropha sp. 6PLUC2]